MKLFQEEPDSTLVAAAKNKESEAFAVLVKRHETRLLAVAFRMLRDREDARDIVQQSFYKAFVHLGTFQGNSSFSTWMTRIVINEALMCMRKNRSSREVSLEDIKTQHKTVISMEIADSGESPAEMYEEYEKLRSLSKAMDRLDSKMRTALLLWLEDRTIVQAAELLGVAPGTLKARLFRARQQLRELLTPGLEFRRRPSMVNNVAIRPARSQVSAADGARKLAYYREAKRVVS